MRAYFQLLRRALAYDRGIFCPSGKNKGFLFFSFCFCLFKAIFGKKLKKIKNLKKYKKNLIFFSKNHHFFFNLKFLKKNLQKKCNFLSFANRGYQSLTRALQSTPFQNSGGGTVIVTDEGRTKILLSNIRPKTNQSITKRIPTDKL